MHVDHLHGEIFRAECWDFRPLCDKTYRRAILTAVTSECSLKRVICKTWTGTLANNAVQDQTPQNAASDHGLDCLLK